MTQNVQLGTFPSGRPIMKGINREAPTYVYRCYDAEGALLYIGCSNNPVARVMGHRDSSWWGGRIARVRNTVYPDRDTALAREKTAIYSERPACNVTSRWYKHDPRPDWTLEDYRTYREAVVRSSNGFFGTGTARLLRAIEAEAQLRFGVSLREERVA